RSSQQHHLQASVLPGKGLHHLKRSCKGYIPQQGPVRSPAAFLLPFRLSPQVQTGRLLKLINLHRRYIPSSSTFFLIQSATCSTFSPLRMLVNRKGLSPRIFLESRSITERSAPT